MSPWTEAGRDGEVRHVGTIAGAPPALDRALRRLVSSGRQLRIVHEAGPCRFVIYRHLLQKEMAVG